MTKFVPVQNEFDIHETVHRDTIMKVTNKMQIYRLIYYSIQLYMFRAMFSPIIRSTWLYLQYLVVFTQVAARFCKYSHVLLMMSKNIAPKHVELTWNNKLTYICILLVTFIIQNEYLKIPPSTSMNFATRVQISQVVRLKWRSRFFMWVVGSRMGASNSSGVSTFIL